MAKDDFVMPSTVRLLLDEDDPDGDWIEVKSELTYEEEQRLVGTMVSGYKMEEGQLSEYSFDWAKYRMMRLLTYITDWSLQRNGKQVDVTRANIAALRPERAEKISEVLDKHVEKIASLKAPTPIDSSEETKLLS